MGTSIRIYGEFLSGDRVVCTLLFVMSTLVCGSNVQTPHTPSPLSHHLMIHLYINIIMYIVLSLHRYLDVILKIDPHSGKVLHTYDFRDLFPAARRPRSSDCFNGIAYNTTDRTVTLTGKYWPKMYRVSMPL